MSGLLLGQEIGKAKITEFLEEPNTGLAIIKEEQEHGAFQFIVPCWLLDLVVEADRLRDLMQQVCEPCAFGEPRIRDEVFGYWYHAVSGVYGSRSEPCSLVRKKTDDS